MRSRFVWISPRSAMESRASDRMTRLSTVLSWRLRPHRNRWPEWMKPSTRSSWPRTPISELIDVPIPAIGPGPSGGSRVVGHACRGACSGAFAGPGRHRPRSCRLRAGLTRQRTLLERRNYVVVPWSQPTEHGSGARPLPLMSLLGRSARGARIDEQLLLPSLRASRHSATDERRWTSSSIFKQPRTVCMVRERRLARMKSIQLGPDRTRTRLGCRSPRPICQFTTER